MDPAEKYAHLTREEAIDRLVRRDRQARYGLVWEREGIERDNKLNGDFVVFDDVPELGEGPVEDRRDFIIEGDNWDALRALAVTHRRRIRCVFIDPPYNTGEKDFSYNDRYVGPDDAYRSSTWLDFLHRRISLIPDVLAEDGVVLVCINDDNRARLDLLMEQTLPGMRVGSFVWRTRTAGGGEGDRYLSVDHEHVLIYAAPGFCFAGLAKTFSMYRNEDAGGRWRPVSLSKRENRLTRENSYYPLQDPDTGVWYPCNPDRVWAFVRRENLRRGKGTSMEELVATRRVLFPSGNRVETWATREALDDAIRRGDVPRSRRGAPLLRADLPQKTLDFFVGKPVGWGSLNYKLYAHEVKQQEQAVSSLVAPLAGGKKNRSAIVAGTNAEGTKLLRQILGGEAFSYPKPLSLVREIIARAIGPDDTVLDFFAGSGTTAHAVLALNAEDEGQRRFVIVSNTEATEKEPTKNLCRDVCAERVRRVVRGYDQEEGIGGAFAYLRATRVEWPDVPYDVTHRRVWTMLQLAHGAAATPLKEDEPMQSAPLVPDDAGLATLVYIPVPGPAVLESLRHRLTDGERLVVFSPVPGPIREAIAHPSLTLGRTPNWLLDRFPQTARP